MDLPDASSPRSNLNTILLTVTLGVLSFIGWISYNNAIQLASITASLVPRAEIEAKLAEVKSAQSAQGIEQNRLALSIERLKFEIENPHAKALQ